MERCLQNDVVCKTVDDLKDYNFLIGYVSWVYIMVAKEVNLQKIHF